jgi:peptide/nickel transport system permease protein
MSTIVAKRPQLHARPPAFWQRALGHRSFVHRRVLTLLLLLAAALSLVWTPWSPYEMDMAGKLQPPARALAGHRPLWPRRGLAAAGGRARVHPGGRDRRGHRPGGRHGAGPAGRGAARLGRRTIMRLSDFTFAFPAILSAIMMTAVFGAGIVNAIIAIGIYNIPTFARITRASANAIWSARVRAGRARLRQGPWRITLEHVLPNILSVLIVQATIRFALAILAEAALSYLGLGTQPPQPSWGRMLARRRP